MKDRDFFSILKDRHRLICPRGFFRVINDIWMCSATYKDCDDETMKNCIDLFVEENADSVKALTETVTELAGAVEDAAAETAEETAEVAEDVAEVAEEAADSAEDAEDAA